MLKRGKGGQNFIWRAGLLSAGVVLAFLFSGQAASAAPVAPTAAVTSSVSVNSIRLDWTPGVADSSLTFSVEQSVSGGAYTRIATFSTSSGATNFYVFTGLATDTLYGFRVNAGDDVASSTYLNATTTYTLATAAGTPTVTAATSSLQIVLNTATNPTNTFYAIFNTTTGQYLTSTGTATASPTFFTSSTWANGSATGLTTNAAYQFVVIARNGMDVNAATSSANTAVYTLVNSAGTPTVSGATTSTLNLALNTNTNPASATYAVFNTTTQNFLTSAGASTGTPTYFASSSWGGVVTGLNLNTLYQFIVIARNGGSVNAASSSASTALYTLANAVGTASTSASGTSTMAIQFTANSNPTSTTYALYNATLGSYLDSAGAVSTTAVFQATSTWGATITATGLTANTNYQFGVIARNGNSVNAATTSASSVFTLASLPTGLTSTTQDASSITLGWSGDASQYSVVNLTTGLTTDFASGTSATVSGLGCYASYYFQVQGRNGNAIVTAFATSSLLFTSACSSGGAGVTVGIGGSVSSGGGSSGGFSGSPAPSPAPSSPTVLPSSPGLTINQPLPFYFPFFAPLPLPVQPVSKIAFSGLPKTGVSQKIGTSFGFRYTVTNASGAQRQVRVERSLVDATGRVVNKTSVLINQRKGQVFTALPKVTLSRSLKPGNYEVRIRVLSAKGAVIESKNFPVIAK
jgi:hypothetical protein